jgi:hypothetical protein
VNVDFKTALDVGVLVFSGISAWNNARMRAEINRLKLWIVQNFHAKPHANFLDDNAS